MNNEKNNIDRELLIEFQESILEKFKALCDKDNITPDFYTLIDFMYQTNVIKDLTIAKFMVMELYPAALFENESKMNAILDISIQTGLSEKTVYNMIQHPESFGYGISKKRNKKNNNK
jgi:hypothetical protein